MWTVHKGLVLKGPSIRDSSQWTVQCGQDHVVREFHRVLWGYWYLLKTHLVPFQILVALSIFCLYQETSHIPNPEVASPVGVLYYSL